MKPLKVITTGAQIVSGLMLISSFFVKDNDKAVKRRWNSLKIFGAAWGVEIAAKLMAPKTV